MLLGQEAKRLFLKLHHALMRFVLQQTNAINVPHDIALSSLSPSDLSQLRDALVERLDLIYPFIQANPAHLSTEELGIVSSWRHLIPGRFIALRQLKQYAILLSTDRSSSAYAVIGLSAPIEKVTNSPLPAMIETVLLPFQGKIIYDGLVKRYEVEFGSGMRQGFADQLRTAHKTGRFFTSLLEQPSPKPGISGSKPSRPKRVPAKAKVNTAELLSQLLALTDAFCLTHLNEEYALLCRKLAEKLARKRPSPLLRGELKTWACAVVRTIGWANFLDDRSRTPHMKLPLIDQHFGVAQSTGQGKSKAIRQLLHIHQFDHEWVLPSHWDEMSPIWLLRDSNGFMIDIRQASPELQRSAFRQELIPYVPADRAAAAAQKELSQVKSRLLYQFKIILRDTEPPIWRRIQVFDDTLDKLHESIQAAMGWTNSHLHQFSIGSKRCGDPELLNSGPEAFEGLDSTRTLISAIVPVETTPFSFKYEYDFGDSWIHEIIFEGCPQPEPGMEYPRCLEGERACPPEDVGGPGGLAQFLEAVADPNHKRHRELLKWNGPFQPDRFNPKQATHVMQEGLPDWRKMV